MITFEARTGNHSCGHNHKTQFAATRCGERLCFRIHNRKTDLVIQASDDRIDYVVPGWEYVAPEGLKDLHGDVLLPDTLSLLQEAAKAVLGLSTDEFYTTVHPYVTSTKDAIRIIVKDFLNSEDIKHLVLDIYVTTETWQKVLEEVGN